MTSELRVNGVERVFGRCGGAPVVAGTRIPTRAVFGAWLTGWSLAKCVEQWPSLTIEQVEAAIRFEACLYAWTPWAVRLANAVLRDPGSRRRTP